MKVAKIIEYLKQFDAESEISILVNIEVVGESRLEDVKLYNARLAPEGTDGRTTDEKSLLFNTRPSKQRIID